MSSRLRPFGSSIGTKILIGLTGFGLAFYLITHIAGNLLIFLGPTVFNQYAATLGNNPLIPLIEIGLLLIFLVHVFKTVKMYLANQQARPVRYTKTRRAGAPSRKSLASSTMILSGLWLLVFIVIHVKTFKYGAAYEVPDTPGLHDLYRVEMENFRSPLMVLFYVISMVIVGSHLWHGVASALQSLGVAQPRWSSRLLVAGKTLAVLIAGGFIVIVLWAHFGGAH